MTATMLRLPGIVEELPDVLLPVEPLLSRFGGDTAALAVACGVSRRQVQRWMKQGGIEFDKADKVCIKAGETPEVVWDEFLDFDFDLDDLDDDYDDLHPTS